MGADIASLSRSFLPNNPKLARIIEEVCKEVYRVRFLPKNLMRMLINRAVEEIRRSGQEFMKDPEFIKKMEQHAQSLHGRFRGEISMLNNGARNKARV